MSITKLTALAALQNPCTISANTNKSHAILLDANFYVGDDEPNITAVLKFFNNDNLNFTNTHTYFLCGHVGLYHKNHCIFSEFHFYYR
jgi:hypothetical protein